MAPPLALVLAADFDPSNLVFGPDVKKYEKSTGQYLPVLYNEDGVRKILALETPTMRMPFGVSEYEGQKNIDLSFQDASGEVEAFQRKMAAVDAKVFDTVSHVQQALLGRQHEKATLAAFHNKILKEGSKKEYGLSMKIKYPKMINDRPDDTPRFFNAQFEETSETHCESGCAGRVIMELRPLYAVGGKFGVKWIIKQVVVEVAPLKLNNCAFSTKKAVIKPAEESNGHDEEMKDGEDNYFEEE